MSDEISDEQLLELFGAWPIDRDSAAHYRGWLEHRLLLNRCTKCGTWHHPPRPVCPSCWSWDVTPTEVAGTGRVFMFMLMHQGPLALGIDYQVPHPVVTVELDEQPGLRYTTTVVGVANESIRIGAPAQLDWAVRGGVPMPTFRLGDSL